MLDLEHLGHEADAAHRAPLHGKRGQPLCAAPHAELIAYAVGVTVRALACAHACLHCQRPCSISTQAGVAASREQCSAMRHITCCTPADRSDRRLRLGSRKRLTRWSCHTHACTFVAHGGHQAGEHDEVLQGGDA